MILDYEAILGEIERRLSKDTHATAMALAKLPEEIRGFGHVKLGNYEKAKRKEAALLGMLRDPRPARVAAE
jgi:indolepyruvate ferredoxin oxidoreductase